MKEQLIDVIKKDAVFRQKVVLASGKESDYYVDLRRVTLSGEGIYLASHLIWDEIKEEKITAIGGMTLGADPIVAGVCMAAYTDNHDLKGFLIRKAPKKHGRQKLIEGKELDEQDRVVVVDDVATSGGSLVKSIQVLEEHNITVSRVMVIVDRKEGASERLADMGYELCPLLTIDDIAD